MSDGETERFSVVVFDADGWWYYADRNLDAKAAVTLSKELVDLAGTPLGTSVQRVMITDSDDNASFLWRRGLGIVYPPLTNPPVIDG